MQETRSEKEHKRYVYRIQYTHTSSPTTKEKVLSSDKRAGDFRLKISCCVCVSLAVSSSFCITGGERESQCSCQEKSVMVKRSHKKKEKKMEERARVM